MTAFDDSTLARFWSKVDRNGPVPEHVPELGQCWVWMGGPNTDRYGHFYVDGKSRSSHRLSWVMHHGAIPEGLCVLHRCDNMRCVRPDHLWVGTNSANIRDRHVKGRDAKGPTSGRVTKPERTARGDRSGYRRHPERFPKGDSHWTRLHPERVPVGDQNWAHRNAHLMPRGSRNGNAKMTEALAAECLRDHEAGETVRHIAERLGMHSTTIYDLVRGLTWRHVKGPRRATTG